MRGASSLMRPAMAPTPVMFMVEAEGLWPEAMTTVRSAPRSTASRAASSQPRPSASASRISTA